jgi:predicted anti-sigma-YlaC factor YlaD
MTMMRHPRGVLCDRARAWAALAPDGELSELERKLLDSHLHRCVSCADFAVRVAAVAAELRAASLQPLPRPVSVPVWRRRQAYARVRAVGAAAAVAAMALGIAARAPLSTGERDKLQLPRVTNFANNADREVALIIRRAENDQARSHLRFTAEGFVTRPI